MRWQALLLLLLLACCSPGPITADGAVADGAAADDDTAEPVDERSRLIRHARDKREQCSGLIDAMQHAEGQAVVRIVNLNDAPRLRELANKIERGLAPVKASALELTELAALRDDYLQKTSDMAAALRAIAQAADETAKKQHLERHRELDAAGDATIDAINNYCNE